jgi:cytochrome c-type biogenesis protein
MTKLTPTFSKSQGSTRWTTFFHACLFVAGFALVFIIGWGGAATLFGQVFASIKTILARVGGILIITFGLSTLGLFRLPWMYYSDTRPAMPGLGKSGGWASSALMGVVFAAGWTPCIGTTLGAILTLGFSQNGAGQAMLLASGYALGLGIPFLLLGLGVDRAVEFIGRFRRYARIFQIVNGVFLIALGLILLFNKMTLISILAQKNGWYFDLSLAGAMTPSYLLSIAAGMISFFSPCVLPLVPAYLGYLSGRATKGGEFTAVKATVN